MIEHIYISITGKQQGLISEGCSSEATISDNYHPDHLDEITLLSVTPPEYKYDIDSGPTIPPYLITKHLDRSTPLLLRALAEAEILNCEINFYRESEPGIQEKYYTVTIQDAVIVSQHIDRPNIHLEKDAEIFEQIGFLCRSYTGVSHEKMIYGPYPHHADS
ncbi:MAG: type secretion system protein [Pseudomonas sp.]|nr:type secretion system protein [Pseudomonas sp.]